MGYYPGYICKNGHPVSTSSNSCRDKFCSKCGSPVISKCENCSETIKGKYDGMYGTLAEYEVPKYCRSCGKPYPWTVSAIEATVYMLEESELEPDECQKLIDVLPDVIVETPRTQLATVRFQKAMSKLGSFAADGLKQFAITFGCEIIKSKLGLP